MSIDKIKEGVILRHKVDELVNTHIEQAYKIARSIKHPWYRCQSLAKVAESTAKSSGMIKILQESFDSAMQCHDENRRVSVACWPMEVAIKNNLLTLANSFLETCCNEINQDMDPISKWCAASLLHVIKSNKDLLSKFYDTFVDATSKGHGWKVERTIKYLLNDEDIKQDKRYIEYLTERQNLITKWKLENVNKLN